MGNGCNHCWPMRHRCVGVWKRVFVWSALRPSAANSRYTGPTTLIKSVKFTSPFLLAKKRSFIGPCWHEARVVARTCVQYANVRHIQTAHAKVD
jgi:hypothetical protein